MQVFRSVAVLAVLVVCVGVVGLTFATPAHAADVYVRSLAGSDTAGNGSLLSPYATITRGLSLAGPGDTVWVGLGSYPETVTLETGVRVVGAGPALSSIVASPNPVIAIEVSGAALEGFTISGGAAFTGGALYCTTSTVTFADLVTTGNTAFVGAGLSAIASTLTLSDCAFEDGGGALAEVYIIGSHADFEGCSIPNGSGGAMTVVSSELTMRDCSVTGYSAGLGCGGIAVTGGSASLTRCTISGNSGLFAAGGIQADSTTLDLTDCTLSGNSSGVGGGLTAIDSVFTMDGCEVSYNGGGFGVGGLSLAGGTTTIRNSTIIGNGAGMFSTGGLQAASGTLRVEDTTIGANGGGLGSGGVRLTTMTATFADCSILANSASFGAGGMQANDTSLTLTGGRIDGNVAGFSAGGLQVSGGSVRLRDVVVTRNDAVFNGSGLVASGCSFEMSGCSLTENLYAFGGGGAVLTSCTGTVIGSSITSNSAGGGAGLVVRGGGMVISGCTFENNSGMTGPGLEVVNGDSAIEDCVFRNNAAAFSGGGLVLVESDSTVTGCSFEGNTAGTSGAAAFCVTATASFESCVFDGNAAPDGAVLSAMVSTVTATNCLLDANTGSAGAIVRSENGNDAFVNCTIVDNSVGAGRAAVEASAGVLSVTNSVLWGNGSDDASMCVVTYSDTESGEAGLGNISLNPSFLAAPGNYRLTGGSPCVDAATSSVAPPDDLDGIARPVDGDGDTVAIADMGAYEYHAPTAVDDAYTTPEDQTLVVFPPGVLVNDVSPVPLTSALASGPAHGSALVGPSGVVTYTPTGNYNGTDAFTYRVSDGTLWSLPATVTITVTPVNDDPVGSPDTTTCAEDGVAVVQVLTNDSDIDGDPLTAAIASLCGHGSATVSTDGVATYTPDPNWFGTDSFRYLVSDGAGGSFTSTVTVIVTPDNDPPVAVNDTTTCNEDGAQSINVLANDIDIDGGALTATLGVGPTNGTLLLNADGSCLYRPAANWSGTDTFTYRAFDGAAYSNMATFTVTVNAVNDVPIAVPDSYGTAEDAPLSVVASGVLANDTDVEGDPLSASIVTTASHGSAAVMGDGALLYVPVANWSGIDTFTYRVWDGTAFSGAAVVTVTVSGSPDPPVAVDEDYTTAEDTQLVVAVSGVLGNDSDPDGDPLSTVLVDDVSHGALALAGDGSFTYTPDGDWSGSDFFTYRASDGGSSSNLARVGVTVTAVNDAPVAVPETYTVGQDATLTVAVPGVLGNDTDVEGGPLAASLDTPPSHGTLVLAPDGSLQYRPADGFVGTDSFAYAAIDGAATSTPVTVGLVVSDTVPPVTSSNAAATYNDSAFITLTATDNASGVAATYFSLDGAPASAGTSVTCAVLGAHTLAFWSVDGVGNVEATRSVTFTIVPSLTRYSECAGADRYETAVKISQAAFPAGASCVIVATGEEWPDALGSAALAGAKGAPVLLTMHGVLPDSVRAEITRLGARQAIVVGGERAVGAVVYRAIEGLVGSGSASRIGGADRHATARLLAAAAVAELGPRFDGKCFIATPDTFPDALAAGPLAVARGWPVYLSGGDDVPLETLAAMRSAGVTDVLVLGGEAAVSPMAEWRLETTFGHDHVRRLFGGTRYRTAVEVARYGVAHAGLRWDGVAIGTGQDFPDALTGGIMQARAGSVLVLTPRATLDADLREALVSERDRIGHVTYLGGTSAVSAGVRSQIAQVLR